MKARVLALALALALPCAVNAQVSDELYKDIETMLDLSGGRALGAQMSAAMTGPMLQALRRANPNITEAQTAIVSQVIGETVTSFLADKATTDAFVEIYARHFTGDEIKQVIAFYSSAAGKKLVAEQPQVAQEAMQASQTLFITKWGPQLQQQLAARMQAAGIAMPGAPAPAAPPAPAAGQ